MKKIIDWFKKFDLWSFISSDSHQKKDRDVLLEENTKKPETPTKWWSSSIAHQKISFNTRAVFSFWLIGLVILLLAYLIFQSLSMIYLVLTAFIIALAVDDTIVWFWNKGLSRWLAIAVTYLLLVILILSWIFLLVPFVLTQMTGIVDSLLQRIREFQLMISQQWIISIVQGWEWLPWYVQDSLLTFLNDPENVSQVQSDLQSNISNLVSVSTNYAQTLWTFAVGFVTGFVTFLAQLGIVLTLSIFFSIEKRGVMRFLSRLTGTSNYTRAYNTLDRIYRRVGLWLRWQLFVCLCVWLAVFIILTILGFLWFSLPSKWSLAVIAWLTNFIPYLWPFLWGIPAILLALVHLWIGGAFVVLLAYVVIQQLESSVLVPVVMKKTVGISPLLILLTVIIGGLVMGFLGVVIAVPIAVIITILFESKDK